MCRIHDKKTTFLDFRRNLNCVWIIKVLRIEYLSIPMESMNQNIPSEMMK